MNGGQRAPRTPPAIWVRLLIVVPLVVFAYLGFTSLNSYDLRPWLLALGWMGVIAVGGALSPSGRAAAAQRKHSVAQANAAVFASGSPVIIRSYAGRNQAEATGLYAREAAYAASQGYAPVSQSWGEGRPGAGRILALGLYANVARPAGTLTVTYRLDDASRTAPAERN